MGPIEILFLTLIAVFVVIGIVRGYARELGVTTMLLIGLFVLEFLSERYAALLDKVLGIVTEQQAVGPLRAWIYVIVLLILLFISYQGQTLSFSGKGNRPFFDVGVGLLNGYLFAGSIWYYLAQASWPGLPISQPFTPFYEAMLRLLPPAVFSWPYFIALAVILLIARVWK